MWLSVEKQVIVAPNGLSRSSSSPRSFRGFRRSRSSTRKAFGSTASDSPALTSSRTSKSANLKTKGLVSFEGAVSRSGQLLPRNLLGGIAVTPQATRLMPQPPRCLSSSPLKRALFFKETRVDSGVLEA